MTHEVAPRAQLARVLLAVAAAAALITAPVVAWDMSSSPPRTPAGSRSSPSPIAGALRSAARGVASGIAAEYSPGAAPPTATVTAPPGAVAAGAATTAGPKRGVVITATKAIVIGPGVTVGGSGLTLRCK
jgi:hypothetical protein